MSRKEGSGPVRVATDAIMRLESREFVLGVLVLLAAAGSFFVPSDWFLWLNPEPTEIEKLHARQNKLKPDLANAQGERHEAEYFVLLTKSDLDKYQNALMRLAQRQVSTKDVVDPFDDGPSPIKIINAIKQEGVLAQAAELSEEEIEMHRSTGASSHLMEQIAEARGHLADYANQNKAISAALKSHDQAEQKLNEHQFQSTRLGIRIAGIEEEIRVVTARLHDITRQSTNQYLAMRAVALGALGAFAAALAAFLHGAAPEARLQHDRTMLSMVFGGIVALVVFALFTTRELSVFANVGATPDEIPDHWRVVILCLIAGAFADRLFAAVRARVDQATRDQGEADGQAARDQDSR